MKELLERVDDFDRAWSKMHGAKYDEKYAIEKAAFVASLTFGRMQDVYNVNATTFARGIINVTPIMAATKMLNKYFPDDRDDLRQDILDRIFKAYHLQQAMVRYL